MSFIDPNDFEAVALETASELGGAYIASENMNNILPNEWRPDQWKMLVETIVSGYISSLQDQNDGAMKALRRAISGPRVDAGQYPSFKLESVDGEMPR